MSEKILDVEKMKEFEALCDELRKNLKLCRLCEEPVEYVEAIFGHLASPVVKPCPHQVCEATLRVVKSLREESQATCNVWNREAVALRRDIQKIEDLDLDMEILVRRALTELREEGLSLRKDVNAVREIADKTILELRETIIEGYKEDTSNVAKLVEAVQSFKGSWEDKLAAVRRDLDVVWDEVVDQNPREPGVRATLKRVLRAVVQAL